jgi:3-oxoacyl-[acyl-carrier protein] reductase
MHIGLHGKTALVTGAAQGIGRAIARGLQAAGAAVHLADIEPIGWADGLFACHQADLGKRPQVVDLVSGIVKAAGRLDIVINAAGGVRGQIGRPLGEIDEQDWRTLFEANVDSAFWLAQAASEPMKQGGAGRLIFIASGAGLRPSLTGIQAYTSAKHALVGLTKQLSQDLGQFGITSNAIAPGFVRSNPATERQWERYGIDGQRRLIESIHVRRTGDAVDIANAAVFLASDQAAWISGQIISVDGGRS